MNSGLCTRVAEGERSIALLRAENDDLRKAQRATQSATQRNMCTVVGDFTASGEEIRGDVAALKAEVEALQNTVSRFVTSEKKEKYYQAILEEDFKAGHLRIEDIHNHGGRACAGRGHRLHLWRAADHTITSLLDQARGDTIVTTVQALRSGRFQESTSLFPDIFRKMTQGRT
jgi:hypothetical protein